MPPSVKTCGRQREQLAVAGDEAAALEGEENAARGGARQIGGAREIAQRHRAVGGAELLQQAQAAVEALDEIGGALRRYRSRFSFGIARSNRRQPASKIVLAVATESMS